MVQCIYVMPSFDKLPQDLFYPQNLGSTIVSHVLNVIFKKPSPGDYVLDMCAAPGGKTTHMAALMENKGKIIALDKSGSRLKHLISTA